MAAQDDHQLLADSRSYLGRSQKEDTQLANAACYASGRGVQTLREALVPVDSLGYPIHSVGDAHYWRRGREAAHGPVCLVPRPLVHIDVSGVSSHYQCALPVLITSVPYLVAKYRGHSLASVLKGATNRVRTGNAWPTRDELQERGRSLAWTYCLPGMVYLWLLW